jgi:hypothetical protein
VEALWVAELEVLVWKLWLEQHEQELFSQVRVVELIEQVLG